MPIEEARRLAGVEDGAVNAVYIRLDKAVTATGVGELIKREIPGAKIASPSDSLPLPIACSGFRKNSPGSQQ